MIQNIICLLGCGLTALVLPRIGAYVFCENGRSDGIDAVLFVVGVMMVAQKVIF